MEERAGERRHSRDRLLAQTLAENDLLKVHEESCKGPPLPDPLLPPREEREKPASTSHLRVAPSHVELGAVSGCALERRGLANSLSF
jgi:hypothetical protein